MIPGETPRARIRNRLHSLKMERASWDSHWKELIEYIRPRAGRFYSTDRNQGAKKHTSIVNGTALWASRVLSSGMMAGITSPARPWFRLTTPDPKLAEFGSVRAWLHQVEERIRMALTRSNLYLALQQVYDDLGTLGVATLHIDEDAEDVLRAYTFPIGQYCLSNSARQRVDTVYRELSLTVRQVVQKFGLERCSDATKQAWKECRYDDWVEVVHCIHPNESYDKKMMGPPGMPFSSTWMELKAPEGAPMLQVGGYEEFPVMAPRWMAYGEDVYGSSPGMDALGDARALQVLEKRKAQLVDKIANPPMKASAGLRGQRASLLPGDVTYLADRSNNDVFEPAMVVPPQAVAVVGQEILQYENRINRAYYADLWLMLSQSDNPQMTAREVAERHEEKMLQLGPVMERLQDELLDPLIDRVFGILNRAMQIPEAPKELQGKELKVEYISVMAQAQKLLGTSSIERLASFVGHLKAVNEDITDKLNMDKMVDKYGEALGVIPEMIRTDEEVAAIRSQKAKAQQQMMAAQQVQQGAQAAKLLSETEVQDDNMLTRLMGNVPAGMAGIN